MSDPLREFLTSDVGLSLLCLAALILWAWLASGAGMNGGD